MKLDRPPKAVVFDMDGVLFDTEMLYRAAMFSAGDEGGHTITEALFNATLGCPWPTARQHLLDHFGSDFPADDFRHRVRAYFDQFVAQDLPLKPGVVALLDVLDAAGLPRAIATSSGHEQVRHHLAHHGLADRFMHVVAFGDYQAGKPAPDPYLLAAERLGIAPADCLALEDSHNGVRSAAAAGMMTVMVPDLMAPTSEMQDLCAHIVEDLHAVRDIVLTSLSEGHLVERR
ncbi:HAD family hydrolase [Sphingobium sp. B12D2B]|uniref:HAD family hydrolase n=1 Tax=Sphingobium sp. B12D2B TaxID=2940577 RepID=UPI002224EE85|nr:HAD family phosphatase [Sphingobium sp. B12D2B]MCW2350527.1 HAD superfamily hydrolase (TIGR01509 family) [Sphingobium sp. B12D2B]